MDKTRPAVQLTVSRTVFTADRRFVLEPVTLCVLILTDYSPSSVGLMNFPARFYVGRPHVDYRVLPRQYFV